MKRLLTLLCSLLLLTGCTPAAPAQEDTLTITATTYPVYLFALSVTQDIPGVHVERLDTGSVSCLHDYTLSVNDMKKIEQADVLAVNGAGLEDFMTDVLASTSAHVIDCSQNIELLPATNYHDHEHDADHDHGYFDPHYWMDPFRARTMVDNLHRGLSQLLPEQTDLLRSNATLARVQLQAGYELAWSCLHLLEEEDIAVPGLVTFHDGFQYFTDVFDLPLLRSIEEEAGSEASAREIEKIIRLVREHDLPVIFTEVNGSHATANAIARETGCTVAQLSMIMDGPEPAADDHPVDPYVDAFLNNVYVLINGFSEREVLQSS